MTDYNVDLSEMDTEDRLASLEEQLDGEEVTVKSAFAALSDDDVMGSDTQHQVVMQAATGLLTVRIPGARAIDVQL